MLPSQDPDNLFARDLREKWVDTARSTQLTSNIEDAQRRTNYIYPHNAVPTESPLTNSDIPNGVQDANRYYQYKSYLENHPLSQALNRAGLESKANVVFKGKSIEDLNTAKLILGDQGYQAAQGQFYNKLLGSKNLDQVLAKYTPEYLTEALGAQRASQLQKLAHFTKITDAIKKTMIAATGIGATAEGIHLLRH